MGFCTTLQPCTQKCRGKLILIQARAELALTATSQPRLGIQEERERAEEIREGPPPGSISSSHTTWTRGAIEGSLGTGSPPLHSIWGWCLKPANPAAGSAQGLAGFRLAELHTGSLERMGCLGAELGWLTEVVGMLGWNKIDTDVSGRQRSKSLSTVPHRPIQATRSMDSLGALHTAAEAKQEAQGSLHCVHPQIASGPHT